MTQTRIQLKLSLNAVMIHLSYIILASFIILLFHFILFNKLSYFNHLTPLAV